MVFFHTRRDAIILFHRLEKPMLIECDIFPPFHGFSAANIEALVVYCYNLTIFLCWAHHFCLMRGKKVEVFFSNEKQNDARVVLAQPRGPDLWVFFLERKTKFEWEKKNSKIRPEGLGQHHPSVILFEWEKKTSTFFPRTKQKWCAKPKKNYQIITVNY